MIYSLWKICDWKSLLNPSKTLEIILTPKQVDWGTGGQLNRIQLLLKLKLNAFICTIVNHNKGGIEE